VLPTQAPFWQVAPFKQGLSQTPQWVLLVKVLTQLAPQAVSPAPQAAVHAFWEQNGVFAGQIAPHMPQFCASLDTSTQFPPQSS
jgi:hypothetical protein